MTIPPNLIFLRRQEQELAKRSEALVASQKQLLDRTRLMASAMDVMDIYRQHHDDTRDERTMALLAMRTFNAFAACWRLTCSGYYQKAAMVLRDVVETSYLVDYLYRFPSEIERWIGATPKELKTEFSPFTIRTRLDADTGQGKSRREEIYKRFCTLAAHPTADGFAMLHPRGHDAVIGPFLDESALRALIEEIAPLASQAGLLFALRVDVEKAAGNAVVHGFLRETMFYGRDYLGRPYSDADFEDLDRIFA
ncbi:hypothetical protein [Lysobacter sp. HA18]